VALTICTAEHDLAGAAFAPDDADLDGYVVLDWDAFEEWHEEDERVIGHPHDPFDRIDCLRSSRHVVISLDGQVLADTTRATLLFETPLGMRYYLPREDVRMDLLGPSAQQSICAYKGVASYWSVGAGGEEATDIAWGYEHPLHDALPVRDMVCFFTERVDLTGRRRRDPQARDAVVLGPDLTRRGGAHHGVRRDLPAGAGSGRMRARAGCSPGCSRGRPRTPSGH